MIKVGAFDSLGGKRRQYLEIYKQIMDGISTNKKKNIEGQIDLFSISSDDSHEVYKDNLTNVEEFSLKEILYMEKEILGIYTSGHPLSEFDDLIKKYVNTFSNEFLEEDNSLDGKKVTLGGLIASVSIKYTKNNKAMAFITLEDFYGNTEIIIFPNVYEKYFGRLLNDKAIFVNGVVSSREDESPKVIANSIKFMDEIENKPDITLWLKISKNNNINYLELLDLIGSFPGRTPVMIYDEKKKQKFLAEEKYWVNDSERLYFELKKILGDESVILIEK